MPLPPAFRSLVRSRGLSLAVVCTMAIGVGILTTTFGVVDAAVLRPPPFAGADRLAVLYTTHTSVERGQHNERWSYPRIQLLRRFARRFSHIANYTGPAALTLTGTGPNGAESVPGEIVSPSYFAALGVGTAIGRTFLASEDSVPGAHPLVVLGHDLWERRYDSDPHVIGRAIGINGRELTVIGVMPRGFRGLSDKGQLWVPTTMAPVLTYPEYLVTDQDFISVVGRLAPGATLAMANDELRALGPRIYEAIPDTEADSSDHAGATARSLNEARVHPVVKRAVIVLLCGVALLHLLACANVTSLLLGHAIARRQEAAVRLALGSGPRRLFAHYFSEGAILVVAGGAIGVVLASWVSDIVAAPTDVWGARSFYGSLAPFADPDFSWRTLAFGVALTVVSAILVSWGPAAAALGAQLQSGLRDGTRGSSEHAAPRGRPSARGIIVTLETALAVVLLVAGGLMVDSFNRMRRTDLGIDPGQVLTFTLQPSEARVPPSAAPAFITRMLEAITAVPGVVSATVDGGAPVGGTARSRLFIAGRPPATPNDAPPVLRHYVAPDHFRTLGIPLLRGRGFTSQDIAGRPRVTIISETAARTFWPNEDPIGQRVWFSGGSSFDRPDSSAEIIGIARDVVYEPLDVGPNRSSFYTPYAQFTYSWRIYFVRTTGDPSAAVGAIREAVNAVEPDLALTEVQTLTDRIGASWSRQRFDALFYGGMAILALVLAVSGIYAVVSYAVGRRTREMGIRIALGSQAGDVVRLVLREGMMAPLVGLALGAAGTFAVAGLLRASLYGIGPTDARVLASAIAMLFLAALVACLVPARRATTVDPCVALRTE
jgi:putative ABC transport system permease protein